MPSCSGEGEDILASDPVSNTAYGCNDAAVAPMGSTVGSFQRIVSRDATDPSAMPPPPDPAGDPESCCTGRSNSMILFKLQQFFHLYVVGSAGCAGL